VSKAYRIWQSPAARLKVPLIDRASRLLPAGRLRRRAQQSLQGYYRDFYALRHVSFELAQGEALGVIGRNGSGKSTLLQILTGTLQPSEGALAVHGRVAALLELGSGFNPEYTGRENVYLNASILGLTREEVDARFDDIVAFADIGNFLDQPTRTYSSGMTVRLAFAVAVSVEADVLIVDEALSVGDVFFVQKCFRRVREVLDRGATLIFVSHDLSAVQNLCRRSLVLEEGRVVFDGPPEEATSRYYARSASRPTSSTALAPAAVTMRAHGQGFVQARAAILAHDRLAEARARHGERELEVAACSVVDERGEHGLVVTMDATVTIMLLLRAHRPIAAPAAGLHLFDRMDNLVFAAGTRQMGVAFPPMAAGEERIAIFRLGCAVQPGEYTFSVGCSEPSPDGPNAGFVHDRHEGLGPLVVRADLEQVLPFYGVARLPLAIEVM
jgi:ABC-type polysaccharide/polyol phosphate transport system ATPase subunit